MYEKFNILSVVTRGIAPGYEGVGIDEMRRS
jgi:hypothetical protein